MGELLGDMLPACDGDVLGSVGESAMPVQVLSVQSRVLVCPVSGVGRVDGRGGFNNVGFIEDIVWVLRLKFSGTCSFLQVIFFVGWWVQLAGL